MTTKALFVRLEAKPGKESEVAKFLRDGQALVQQEPATTPGSGFNLARPPSASSMRFRTMPAATRTCPEELPKR